MNISLLGTDVKVLLFDYVPVVTMKTVGAVESAITFMNVMGNDGEAHSLATIFTELKKSKQKVMSVENMKALHVIFENSNRPSQREGLHTLLAPTFTAELSDTGNKLRVVGWDDILNFYYRTPYLVKQKLVLEYL